MIVKTRLYLFALITLIVIVMFNLNGIVYLFTGVTGATSLPIFILSIYLFLAAPERKLSPLSNMYFFYFLAYLIVGLLTLIFSDNIGIKSSQTIFDILKTILLVFSMYFGLVFSIKRYGELPITIIAWSVVLSVVLSYSFHVLGISDNITNYRTDKRLSGVFANPNEMAAQALFSLIFGQYLLKKGSSSKIMKFALIISMLISFYVLVLAFSRAMFLSFILIFLMQILFFTKIRIKSVMFVFLVIASAFLYAPIYYMSLDDSSKKRMDATLQIAEGNIDDSNTGGRLQLAEHGMNLIYDSPFWGNGIGSMQHMEGIGGVHNAYLAVWGNAGIFVLLFFLSFIFIFLKKLFVFGKLKKEPTFFFLVLTIVINGISKTGVYEFKINNILFALCLAWLYITYYNPNLINHENSLSNR